MELLECVALVLFITILELWLMKDELVERVRKLEKELKNENKSI